MRRGIQARQDAPHLSDNLGADFRAVMNPDMRLAASKLIELSPEGGRPLQHSAPEYVNILIVIEHDFRIFRHGRRREPMHVDRYDQGDGPLHRCSDVKCYTRARRVSHEHEVLTCRHGGRSSALNVGSVVEIHHRAGNSRNAREFFAQFIHTPREYHAHKPSDCVHLNQRIGCSRTATQNQYCYNGELASELQ